MANGDTVQSYGAVRNPNGSYQNQIAINEKAEQIVAVGLPPYTEQVRKGQAWGTMSTSAVAGLVVRPSTTAALELWNGYATGGKSLIIDRLFWFNLVSAQVAQGFLCWAMVTKSKSAPSSASLTVTSLQGNKTYAGPVVNAVGTTVADNGWYPWAVGSTKPIEATVTPNGGAVAAVEGRLIVPPQCSLCLHVVSQTTASTFTQGAFWYEEQLTLE